MSKEKLDLKDVTLVTLDISYAELTQLAMQECLQHASFGDVKIFTNKRDFPNGFFIGDLVVTDLQDFYTLVLPKYIKTSHVLFFQWDSWIIDPGMWKQEFLEYDYIGAPWWYNDGLNVGNAGFCLRSKTMMDFFMEHPKEFPITVPEDNLLCRHYRPLLPQFKWAPEDLAHDFAFERTRKSIESRHFGYHGVFNWPFIMNGEKLAERMALARKNPYIANSSGFKEIDDLANAFWVNRNLTMVRA